MLLSCFNLFASDKIVFGVLPADAPLELQRYYAPLNHYLKEHLNQEIVLLVANDYDQLLQFLEQGDVDIAALSPKLFSRLRNKDPHARYLATFQVLNEYQERTSTYKGFIVTLEESSIKTLSDLKGKRFGFTDPSSMSGYLYPKWILQQNGIDPQRDFSKTYMLKKHTKVLPALLNRSIDAGAIYDSAYDKLPLADRQRIRILAATPEIPYGVIVASRKLAPSQSEELHRLLLQYRPIEVTQHGIAGFTEQAFKLYDQLNDLK
jgi:phosphonate transport system substrate-binding protein